MTGNQYVNGSPQVSQTNVDGIGNDAIGCGRAAYVPSVDVVQEFKIVLNAYDASYGHSGGSAVDLSLKSGTNKFHGTANYFMRRTWLDTEDFQSNYNGNKKAQHKRDQYGFEVDGPVVIPHLIQRKEQIVLPCQLRENEGYPAQPVLQHILQFRTRPGSLATSARPPIGIVRRKVCNR